MRVTVYTPGDEATFVLEMDDIPVAGDVFQTWKLDDPKHVGPQHLKVIRRQWIIDHSQKFDEHNLPVDGRVHDVWLFAEPTQDSVQDAVVQGALKSKT